MKKILLFSILIFVVEVSHAGVLSSIIDAGNTVLGFIPKVGRFALKTVSNAGREVVNSVSEFFLASNFSFSTEVTGRKDSIDYVSEEPTVYTFSGVDPISYEYTTSLTANPSPKLSFRFSSDFRPSTIVTTDVQSRSRQSFSFNTTYLPSSELQIGIRASRDITRIAPGNPNVGYGQLAIGLFTDYETVIDRITFDTRFKKPELIEVNTNVGLSQVSQTNFATHVGQQQGFAMNNTVGQPSLFGEILVRYFFSPKYNVELSVLSRPDTWTGYYTRDGVIGYFTSSQRIKFNNSYMIRPGMVLTFGLGRTWEKRSTVSEYYGVKVQGRQFSSKRDQDEFWVGLEFRP